MEATRTPIDTIPVRRHEASGLEVRIAASAYHTLLEKFELLYFERKINHVSYNLLKDTLTRVYLERLAEVYVNNRIECFITRANENICRSLSGFLDPHCDQEHQRINHKSRQISLLHNDLG